MIFLYGHPRCGKTTLMHQFGSYHVIDLDEFMLELQNEYDSIGEIYAENPQCFYDLEAKALRLALEQKPCVISLGGGTLLRNTVSGKVIYLQQSLQVLRTLETRWRDCFKSFRMGVIVLDNGCSGQAASVSCPCCTLRGERIDFWMFHTEVTSFQDSQ